MCQQCVDACREVFPDVPDGEMGDFLIGTTCFPFGTPELVREQMQANRAKMTTDDWHECFAIADAEMEAAMAEARAERVAGGDADEAP